MLVEVEGLVATVRRNVGRIADVERAPARSVALVPHRPFATFEATPQEQVRYDGIVPQRVAKEVEKVEVAPNQVAGHSASRVSDDRAFGDDTPGSSLNGQTVGFEDSRQPLTWKWLQNGMYAARVDRTLQ